MISQTIELQKSSILRATKHVLYLSDNKSSPCDDKKSRKDRESYENVRRFFSNDSFIRTSPFSTITKIRDMGTHYSEILNSCSWGGGRSLIAKSRRADEGETQKKKRKEKKRKKNRKRDRERWKAIAFPIVLRIRRATLGGAYFTRA